MSSNAGVSVPDSEILPLIRSRALEYPIASKAHFLVLMNRPKRPVLFRGTAYDAGFGAGLVPEFFFPVTSEDDLITKITQLLMSRGLVALDGPAVPAAARQGLPRDHSTPPTRPAGRAMADVVDDLASQLRRPAPAGVLDREAVEALDVVTHALAFVRHPRALELWRETLRERELSDEVRQAMVRMLEYLATAVAEGRTEEVSRICDCLQVVVRATPPAGAHESEMTDAR
jgi:hypothetical protein